MFRGVLVYDASWHPRMGYDLRLCSAHDAVADHMRCTPHQVHQFIQYYDIDDDAYGAYVRDDDGASHVIFISASVRPFPQFPPDSPLQLVPVLVHELNHLVRNLVGDDDVTDFELSSIILESLTRLYCDHMIDRIK